MTLPQMICNYQNNNDLDSLRDILEYLKSNPVYVITKIKISKKRLLTLPKDEIKFLLENPVSIDNKLYFSIFYASNLYKRYTFFVNQQAAQMKYGTFLFVQWK